MSLGGTGLAPGSSLRGEGVARERSLSPLWSPPSSSRRAGCSAWLPKR